MKSRTHTLSGVGSSISGSVDLDDPLETQSAPSKHEKKAYSEQEKAIDPAKKNTMILFLYDQRRPAMIREIHSEETGKLYECLEALAEHHNKVSVHFKGSYPKTPSEERIKQFESELEEGKSRIAVIENGNDFVGFCKIGTATYQVRTGQNKAIRNRITPLNSLMINCERRETG